MIERLHPGERFLSNYLVNTIVVVISVYLAAYYFEYVFTVPEKNLTWFRMTGEVQSVVSQPSSTGFQLQVHDTILKIGEHNLVLDYSLPIHTSILSAVSPQYTLPMVVNRNGQILRGEWPVGKPAGLEIINRIFGFFPVLIFQASAIITLFFLRPKDTRWRLLVITFSLGAVIIATGFLGNCNLLFSDYILPIAVWVWAAAFIHLVWIYPQPIGPADSKILAFLYLAAPLLAFAEILHALPPYSFLTGVAIVFLSCGALLLLHLFKPGQRRAVIIFLIGFLIILMIFVSMILYATRSTALITIVWMVNIVLPGLPLVILFPIARMQMPGIELRANQTFTNLLYLSFLSAGLFIISAYLRDVVDNPETFANICILLAFITTAVSLYLYPSFKRFVQKNLLGIPLAQDELLQRFSGRISTSPKLATLVRLTTEEVLPALMVRQAAMFRVNLDGQFELLAAQGLQGNQIPPYAQMPLLLKLAGKYLPTGQGEGLVDLPWVRLVLKLEAAGHMVGICLFGQRDPDDFYSVEEIPLIQSLMDQAALALNNIEQSERLHAYHQFNIQRNEEELHRLARDLHDDVLGQMALIQMSLPSGSGLPGGSGSEEFHEAFSSAIARVRRIMNGLRPTMLEYGLKTALEELEDELLAHTTNTTITFNVSGENNPRYPREVETHIFRIVQEACQNAIRHGQPKHLILYGSLTPDALCLDVVDNGKGFVIEDWPEISTLLKAGHYGLVNMVERAHIIGASLDVESKLEKGTHVSVEWKTPQ